MKIFFRIFTYAGAFFVLLVFFLIQVLPYERILRSRLSELEEASGGYQIRFQELGGGLLTGFSLKQPEILSDYPQGKLPFLKPLELKFRIALSTLFTFGESRQASFKAIFNKGKIEGEALDVKDLNQLKAQISAFELSEFKTLQAPLELPLKGSLNGQIDLTLTKKGFEKHAGKIRFDFSNLSFEPFSVDATKKPFSIFSIPGRLKTQFPKMSVTEDKNSRLVLELKKEVFEIKECVLQGKDLDFTMTGKITLKAESKNSSLNFSGKFKFSKTVEDELLKEMPNLEPMLRKKDSEGKNSFTIKGVLDFPILSLDGYPLEIPLKNNASAQQPQIPVAPVSPSVPTQPLLPAAPNAPFPGPT